MSRPLPVGAREELGTIAAELHSLAQTLPSDASGGRAVELRERLGKLEEQVKALERRLE